MSKAKDEMPGFIRQVIGCLTSPRSSLKSILEKPSLLKATALILLIAIPAAWANYNYTGKLPLTFVAEREAGLRFPFIPHGLVSPEQLAQTSMIVNAMTGLVGVFGSWLISSALFHGFSKAQRGKGTFRNMLTLTGFASTPLLIQHLLRLIDSFMASQEEVTRLAVRLQIFINPFLNLIANAVVNTFSIFRLWSIALFVIAVSENHKISTVRSIATAVATYAIMVFLSIFLPL